MEQLNNARFLESADPVAELLRDLREGLRYTEDGVENVFDWRTTYLDLDKLTLAPRSLHDRFGWAVYRFDVPLRLGALEISGLQVNVPDPVTMRSWRLDVAVDNLPFEVRLAGNGAENYWAVKEYLCKALGAPVSMWERDDQLHSEWDADGLLFGLTYWFKWSLNTAESGFVSLNISNRRIFPEYFQDDYTRSFSLDAPGMVWKTFQCANCMVSQNYRLSQWVRFTPEALRNLLKDERADLIVWYDAAQRKLGFAKDEQLCMIVDLQENQPLDLQLADLDRGRFAHELYAGRPDGLKEMVLSAGVGALDGVLKFCERVER